MLWVYGHYKYFTPSVRDRLQTSEVGPRAQRVKFGRIRHFKLLVIRPTQRASSRS